MCFLQPPVYPNRDKREPLPYWVNVQGDPCLCWSHILLIVGFVGSNCVILTLSCALGGLCALIVVFSGYLLIYISRHVPTRFSVAVLCFCIDRFICGVCFVIIYSWSLSGFGASEGLCITKTRLFKYIENFISKNWEFSDKNSNIFHISAQNIYRLWVLVRTASARRF